MLNAKIPLGNYAAKANLVQKVVAEAQANAQYDQSLADFHVDWLNTCTEFKSWDSKLDDVRQAHLNQQERSELEARRFRLGRTSLISIIQAGDDATDAKMSLNQSEILYRQAAWKVMRLAGESKKYLKGLVK